MFQIFELIKIISIIQFSLIILIVLLAYAVKVSIYYKQQRYQKIKEQINKFLMGMIVESEAFKIDIKRRFKRYPVILMESIYFIDASIKHPRWDVLRTNIIDSIILPKARIYSKSASWNHRYIACQFFDLSFKKSDENFVASLMQDPIPIVSVAAVQLAIKHPSQHIIDVAIDIFSQGRRIQQSFYTQIISTADSNVSLFIINRIDKEKNPYIKAFCYRTLMHFPPTDTVVETINIDLHSSNIDLKISSLVYLAYSSPKLATAICINFLNNENWEVRAKSAQLLGALGDRSLAYLLEVCLKDPEWWVRVNAAEALAELGSEGIDILKRQKSLDNQHK